MAENSDLASFSQNGDVVVNGRAGYRVDFGNQTRIGYTDDVIRALVGNGAVVLLDASLAGTTVHLAIDQLPKQLEALGPQANIASYATIVLERIAAAAATRGLSVEY